jgi:hypothetical protein
MTPRTKSVPTRRAVLRAIYVGTLLTTNFDTRAAERASGLKGPHVCEEIGQRLLKTHTLEDLPRSGRPPKYTETHCEMARDYLQGSNAPYHDGVALVADLKHGGQVPADSKARPFLRRFRGHLRSKRKKLVYGQRTRTHSITGAQAVKRLAWSKEHMKDFYTSEQTCRVVFEDETTVEESPHPKGKSAQGRMHMAGLNMAGFEGLRWACSRLRAGPRLSLV